VRFQTQTSARFCTSALIGDANRSQALPPISVTRPSVFSLGRRCLSTRRFLTNLVVHDPHLHRIARERKEYGR
jgi:hypothetical protein